LKRYVLALITAIFVSGLFVYVLDFLAPNYSGVGVTHDKVMLYLNLQQALQVFLVFCAGAWVFGRGALVPGLVLYVAMSIPMFYILYQIAAPAMPGLTIFELFSQNTSGYLLNVVSCVLGLLLGERLALRRQMTTV